MNTIQKLCVVMGSAFAFMTITNSLICWAYYLDHKPIFTAIYMSLAVGSAALLGGTVRLYVDSRE